VRQGGNIQGLGASAELGWRAGCNGCLQNPLELSNQPWRVDQKVRISKIAQASMHHLFALLWNSDIPNLWKISMARIVNSKRF